MTKTTKSEWNKKTRRSFVTAAWTALLGVGLGYACWMTPDEDGVPSFFRTIFRFNERVWRGLFRSDSLGERPKAPEPGTRPRVNGDIGLKSKLNDEDPWQLEVAPYNLTFQLYDLNQLSQFETTAVFKCVEGWSRTISYKGIQFSDFVRHLKLKTGLDPSAYEFVSLETPDGDYYVSVDMASMMHPQTVLALEMNGEALSESNGAPLRLVIPVKYGIKNLKRIGSITFSHEQLADYWTERGYDWYAGL